MRETVTGSVDDVDHLVGVGRADVQGVLAPGPVGSYIDAQLAPGTAVADVEDGLVEDPGACSLQTLIRIQSETC